LFNQGVRPAVNVGVSVSRVGGSAQIPAMKDVAGTLRLSLAQYRELQAFAQFASDLDAATRQQLTRGAKLVEILKQGQYSPVNVEMQIVHILAGTEGYCDDITNSRVPGFIMDLTTHFEKEHTDLLNAIKAKGARMKKGQLREDVLAGIKGFRSNWA
jgi:F-type H+-transporting ATPase subunit alpha